MGRIRRGWVMRLALVATFAATLVRPSFGTASGPIKGIDVSKWQHPYGAAINWRAVAAAGAKFVFIKATDNTNYTNAYFRSDWAAAHSVGLFRGAYHYARPSASLSTAEAQARYYVSVVGTTREYGDFAPVLDFEDSGGLSPSALSNWAHTWLSTVQRLTGRVPILYTYPYFWQTRMAASRSFGAYPLWLASYRSSAPAPLPGWNGWTFWQHTDRARYPGISANVDESYFCCSSGTLAGLADGRTPQIQQLWAHLGGASGPLGLPTAAEVAVPGGWAQSYQHGEIIWAARYGARPITGSFFGRWLADGGVRSPFGVPMTDEHHVTSQVEVQDFTGGEFVYSLSTGVHGVPGAIYARWRHEGGAFSRAGLPTTEYAAVASGMKQQFQHAGMYAPPHRSAFEVPASIRDRYEQLGGPASPLGWPRTDAYPVTVGRQVDFQVGSLIEVDVVGHSIAVV